MTSSTRSREQQERGNALSEVRWLSEPESERHFQVDRRRSSDGGGTWIDATDPLRRTHPHSRERHESRCPRADRRRGLIQVRGTLIGTSSFLVYSASVRSSTPRSSSAASVTSMRTHSRKVRSGTFLRAVSFRSKALHDPLAGIVPGGSCDRFGAALRSS